MAEASTTFGRVTIAAESTKDLANFLYLYLLFQKDIDYPIRFIDLTDETKKEIENWVAEHSYGGNLQDFFVTNAAFDVDLPEKTVIFVDLEFTALGRYEFLNTIEDFFKLADRMTFYIQQNGHFENEDIRLVEEVLSKPLTATWDVHDAESSSDFIVVYDAKIHWDPEKKVQETLYVICRAEASYNASNLIHYNFQDEWEAIDVAYALTHFDSLIHRLKMGPIVDDDYIRSVVETILADTKAFHQQLEDCEDEDVYYSIADFLTEALGL